MVPAHDFAAGFGFEAAWSPVLDAVSVAFGGLTDFALTAGVFFGVDFALAAGAAPDELASAVDALDPAADDVARRPERVVVGSTSAGSSSCDKGGSEASDASLSEPEPLSESKSESELESDPEPEPESSPDSANRNQMQQPTRVRAQHSRKVTSRRLRANLRFRR